MSVALVWLTSGCTRLHSSQVGDIHSPSILSGDPFEIVVSETGIQWQEATTVAAIAGEAAAGAGKEASALGKMVALFQMGPRTGNSVTDATYSDALHQNIRQLCPAGRITGLTITRESTRFPIISDELVRIRGYCQRSETSQ